MEYKIDQTLKTPDLSGGDDWLTLTYQDETGEYAGIVTGPAEWLRLVRHAGEMRDLLQREHDYWTLHADDYDAKYPEYVHGGEGERIATERTNLLAELGDGD